MTNSGSKSSKVLVMALSMLLLTWGFAGSDLAFAHHKEGHSGGSGSGSSGNGNSGNGNSGSGNSGNGNSGSGNSGSGSSGNGNSGSGSSGSGSSGSGSSGNGNNGKAKSKFESLSDVENQGKHSEMLQSKNQGIMVKKTDKRVRELLMSDNPEEQSWKLGLDYNKGKTKLVLELKNLDEKTLEKIKKYGEIETQSNNIIQVSADLNDVTKINSLYEVEKTRAPYSLSDYTGEEIDTKKSGFAEVKYNEDGLEELEKMTREATSDIENNSDDTIYTQEINEIEEGINSIIREAQKTIDTFDNNDEGSLAFELDKLHRDYEGTIKVLEEKINSQEDSVLDTKSKNKLIQLEHRLNTLSQMQDLIIDVELDKNSKAESVFYGNVDIVHTSGITGKNVKVAVLDIAFDTTNEKIVNNIADSKSFKSGQEGDVVLQDAYNVNVNAHGTAVAEIITDIAPDSELFLYEMDTDVEFAAAVDEAIANNVNVIAMAAGWPNLPTDGSSHITKKVEEAIAHGITFVVPSGNFAQKHWEGEFNDKNYNSWHEFSGTDEGLSVEVTDNQILKGQPIMIYLNWQEAKGEQTDFDLVLVDPLGQIVEYSANQQSGSNDEDVEYVYHVPQIPGLYAIGISYAEETDPTNVPKHTTLELFSVNNEIEYAVAKSSVVVPGDAKGAIVVGAVSNEDGSLEPFSSHGPTNDGKMAPHVVGPNGITTLAYNGKLFYGTSATTPYVAGIAALMLEGSNLTPEQVLEKINDNANLDNAIKKNDELKTGFGYGTLDAMFLLDQ